jgi:Na+-translocating ferredoxin:NAD+ oxidoreductase subunit A
MSYLGIVLTSAFAANALLAYGLGSPPLGERSRGEALASAIALAAVNAAAAALLWALRSLVLTPLGLSSADILFFAIVAVPPLKFISRGAAGSGTGAFAKVGARADDLVVGSLVFGVALLSARSGFSLPEAVTAGTASGLGFWLADSLLGAIRERLELSDLPSYFKGAPAMLLSAGLMAMAFMGIDAALVGNMAR